MKALAQDFLQSGGRCGTTHWGGAFQGHTYPSVKHHNQLHPASQPPRADLTDSDFRTLLLICLLTLIRPGPPRAGVSVLLGFPCTRLRVAGWGVTVPGPPWMLQPPWTLGPPVAPQDIGLLSPVPSGRPRWTHS